MKLPLGLEQLAYMVLQPSVEFKALYSIRDEILG